MAEIETEFLIFIVRFVLQIQVIFFASSLPEGFIIHTRSLLVSDPEKLVARFENELGKWIVGYSVKREHIKPIKF